MSLKNEHENLTIDQILRFSDDTNDTQSREKSNREDSEEFPLITRHTVSTSPWSRLGVIAIPFGLGFLAIFYFLNSIFNPARSPEAITAKAEKTSPALEKVDNKDGDVYAKLALNKQEDELEKINQNQQEVKVNNKPVNVAASPPTPTARPVAQTQSPSPRRYYVPNRTKLQISSPRNQTLPRITNPVRTRTVKTVTPQTETPVDVNAEFNRLRSLGSYGKIAYTPTSNNQQISTEATSFQTPNTTRIQLQPPNSAYTTQQTRPNFSNSTPTAIEKIRPRWSANQVADSNYLSQEDQILQQRKTRYLVVGEFANGVLVTPVVKQQSENTRFQQQQAPDDSKRYVARLTADLHDNYGNVAIHKGTLLALVTLQIDRGSYATVQVTSIIKDNTEYPISSGAISVLGEGGKPLIAKQFQDLGGGIAGSDLTVGLVSGLGQVGAILNQSDSSSSVVNSATGTFSSSTTSNSQRNIGGAFLQGAFGKLSDIIARRAEASNQEITARPNVWYIPQGTKITFLVNRSLELP
ncbi:hypothetical protein LC653_34980 [Nostoc sp. CHAB 5784]|uniref:TrbI/VirB10 family protein n=1 Tax=Nostoc mirabile TaxID=2907820 RepID=UPI001E28E471|nr:TrbI/VirB10 family protein [Nostoc mirabile]MCC5668923.1 hypothetical protein [Nostoc mirabile CHAB5784]